MPSSHGRSLTQRLCLTVGTLVGDELDPRHNVSSCAALASFQARRCSMAMVAGAGSFTSATLVGAAPHTVRATFTRASTINTAGTFAYSYRVSADDITWRYAPPRAATTTP